MHAYLYVYNLELINEVAGDEDPPLPHWVIWDIDLPCERKGPGVYWGMGIGGTVRVLHLPKRVKEHGPALSPVFIYVQKEEAGLGIGQGQRQTEVEGDWDGNGAHQGPTLI